VDGCGWMFILGKVDEGDTVIDEVMESNGAEDIADVMIVGIFFNNTRFAITIKGTEVPVEAGLDIFLKLY